MFSNAKSVEINGKEVKSIILENGAILYKKDESYPLSITSDKNILSYYDNDVATLTASLTKGSTPIEGEEVIFYTPNVTIGIEEYSAQDYNYIEMNLEGDGEIILPNSTQFSVQAFTEDGTNVVWEDLSKGDWKIKINNGELNFCLGTNASPSEQSSFVGNKFSIKIFSKTSNDLYEISSSYPVFFASAITQNNGQCSVVYNSQGIGDVLINVECMNLQETYSIEDCYLYDDASSDKSSHFGSNVSLRNSGTGTLSYDSTNHNYNATVVNTGESFIPITSATGLNDLTLEASLHFPLAKDDYLNGLIIYKDSNNWKRLSYMNTQGLTLRRSEGTMSNGSFNEGTIVVQSRTYTGKWLSFKATITNGTLSIEIKDGATTLDTYSVNISGLLTSNTNFGFNCLWASGRVIPFKNIKIKPL